MRLCQFFSFAPNPRRNPVSWSGRFIKVVPGSSCFANMAAAGKKPPSARKREDPSEEGGCRGMTRACWHVTEIKMKPDLGCVPPEVSSQLRM